MGLDSLIFFSNCPRTTIFDWKMDSKARSMIGNPREDQADGGGTATEEKYSAIRSYLETFYSLVFVMSI